MSRHARLAPGPFEAAMACVLMQVASLAGAQTIADYSHAQRAWLESTMSQAVARSAGLAASTPTAPAAAAAILAASAPAGRRPMAAPEPVVRVSGVFANAGGAIAQVVVDATSYLLGVGQGVPGTAWRVQAIAIDKVVLGRPGGGATMNAEAHKVFSLPALD